MTLTLGFSPCPNDTFIFDALVNGQVDTGDLRFEVVLEDVQTLNRWALEGRLDVSKISYGVLPLVTKDYIVLQSGGALGKGVGPLLISRKPVSDLEERISTLSVAIPGENTTAHLLFSLAFPKAHRKQFVVFSEVEARVLDGQSDLGVIIHENRFTYARKGLHKLLDLGTFWEESTGNPIPLGGIVARRTLDPALRSRLDAFIRSSVEYSFQRYPELSPYIRKHAQEMEERVMRQHIDLYVNEYSKALGPSGEKAVQKLLDVYRLLEPDTNMATPLFQR